MNSQRTRHCSVPGTDLERSAQFLSFAGYGDLVSLRISFRGRCRGLVTRDGGLTDLSLACSGLPARD